MARTLRVALGGYCHHILNRGNGRRTVFHKEGDFHAFVKLFREANQQVPMRLLAFCLMPNHFHLVIWPREGGQVSDYMAWLLTAHVRRYRQRYHSSGQVWQGRLKSFPIAEDEHLLTVLRYIVRNPVRANLVERTQDWLWSSAASVPHDEARPTPSFDLGPVPRPDSWLQHINEPQTEAEVKRVRESLRRDRPFGSLSWMNQTAHRLGMESTLRSLREGRGHYPEDAELLLEESQTLDALGDEPGGTACLERLLAGQDSDHFASVATGMRGYLTRHQLAGRYVKASRLAEAEAQWRLALAEQPRYMPAFIGLGDLFMAQSSWPMLDRLLDALEAQMPGSLPAAVLHGRMHLALKEYPAARDWLERAIAQHPREIWPRVVYSRVLVEEGRDARATEQALRDVLAVDPGHAETRQSLEVLLRQQGRMAG